MLEIESEFLEFISNSRFPCIAAQITANKKLIKLIVCNNINSDEQDDHILFHIYKFISDWEKNKELLQSFAVIFNHPLKVSEIEFEGLLWKRLQSLHNLDSQLYPWDPGVCTNVTDPNFSFSLGNTSFFIVGLHQNSSRKARQFIYPTLVFNLHEQFQILRELGSFEKMRDKIRKRDLKYSGSINPMVTDYGTSSEALQYSGRMTDTNYHCPFSARFKHEDHLDTKIKGNINEDFENHCT